MAKKFAVLGSPIQHSKSPQIHLAAYRALGLDWDYDRYEVTEAELADFLKATSLDGLSLTMPLKEIACALAVSDDEVARQSNTANTLLKTSTGWLGFNTDVFGLERALWTAPKSSALILGAGATARNAVLALKASTGSGTISVKARNHDKTDALIEWAAGLGITVLPVDHAADLSDFDLVLSTLPPGSDTQGWFVGTPSGTLLDVAYNPWPSVLATQWLNSGCNVISGIEMLIWQAIAQIRVFLNGSVAEPLENEDEIAEVMRAAAKAEG